MKKNIFIYMLCILLITSCEQQRESLELPSEVGITFFSINGSAGIMDSVNNYIFVTLPSGTDLSDLQPEISISKGAVVCPGNGESVDFNHRLINYRVSSGNLYHDYIVKVIKETGNKIGFIGWEDSPYTEKQQAAFQWLSETYGYQAEYVSLWDIQTEAKDIYDYGVIWFYSDATGTDWKLPFRAYEEPLTARVIEYLTNGGNLLLTSFPVQWVQTLGITADEKNVNNLYGYENKVITSDEGLHVGNQAHHPIFEGLVQEGTSFIPLMGSGATIQNNTAVWYLASWGEYDNSLANWRDATGGTDLATDIVDGDAVRVVAAEFPASITRKGKTICIGSGFYEWAVQGSNPYSDNIEKLTSNAINYLNK